jgi:hypothetical protein
MASMDSVICIRWLATGSNAKAQQTLVSRWHWCRPSDIPQEEMARLKGLSERADPPPFPETYRSTDHVVIR